MGLIDVRILALLKLKRKSMNPDENQPQSNAPDTSPDVVRMGQEITSTQPEEGTITQAEIATEDQQSQQDSPITSGSAVDQPQPVVMGGSDGVVSKPGKNKKKILAIVLIALALSLIGGGVSAYFALVVNSDKNILSDALTNVMKAENVSMDTTATVTVSDGTSVVAKVNGVVTKNALSISANLSAGVGGMSIDAGAELSWHNMKGWSNPGDIYVRTKGLKPLVSAMMPSMGMSGQDFSDLLDKWIRIDESFIKDIQKEAPEKEVAVIECRFKDGFSSAIKEDDVEQLVGLFRDEDFFGIEKDGNEKVNDKDTIVYNLLLKKENLKEIAEVYFSSDMFKNNSCGLSDSEISESKKSVLEAIEQLNKSIKIKLWIDKSSREPVKLSTSLDVAEGTSLKIEVSVKLKGEVDAAPTDYTDIKEYADMLSGFSSGSSALPFDSYSSSYGTMF
jgi:hypothetical protein